MSNDAVRPLAWKLAGSSWANGSSMWTCPACRPAGWCSSGRSMGTTWYSAPTSPQPGFPDSIAIIAPDPGSRGFTQHYFDSRGIVRLYRMESTRRCLESSQRFEGTFSADGDTIDARWEESHDGGQSWQLDFRLTYTRVRD